MIKYADAIRRAKEGNEEAFTFLYEQTYKKSYYVALKYMKNETLAEDVLQESYVVAFKSLDQLDDPEKFPAWLGRIVATRSLNELKKKQPLLFSQTENEEGQDISATFEDDRVSGQPELSMDQQETKRLMQEIIGALSEEQRVCITMFYMEEMSVKEMAEILQVSENTVKSRLNYGRQKIKDKVLDLEKKGTKLYGLAPIPFFLLLCKEEASAATYTIPALSFSSCAQAATVGKTALGGAVAAGAKGLTIKIVAGVVAGTLLVGGGAAAVIHSQRDQQVSEDQYDIPKWVTRVFERDGMKCGKFISIEGYEIPILLSVQLSEDKTTEEFAVYYVAENWYCASDIMRLEEGKHDWYIGENGGRIYVATLTANNHIWSANEILTDEQYEMFGGDGDILWDLEQYSDTRIAVNGTIQPEGYSFDGWYHLTDNDFYSTGEAAYMAWLKEGEEEKEKIYASHFELREPEMSEEQEVELETEAREETIVVEEVEEPEPTIDYDVSTILGQDGWYSGSLMESNEYLYGGGWIADVSFDGDYLTITGYFTYEDKEWTFRENTAEGTYVIPLNKDVSFYSSGGEMGAIDIGRDSFSAYLEKVKNSGLSLVIYVEGGVVQTIGICS